MKTHKKKTSLVHFKKMRGNGLSQKKWRDEVLQTVFIFFLSSIYFSITYRVWEFDPHIPFPYTSGDGMFFSGVVKGIVDNGWYTENPFLGAPFGRELYDFPLFSDMGNLVQIKLLSFLIDDYAYLINFMSFIIFPATAVISFQVLRKLSLSFWSSVGGTMCYTFLTYRVHRMNVGHFFLADYSCIPIMILILFWLIEDELFFQPGKKFFHDRRNWFSLVFLLLFSLKGVYYTFFSCFFVAVVLLGNLIKKKKIRSTFPCFFVLLTLILPLVFSYIPTQFYIKNHGINPLAPARSPFEAQRLSLELAGLFLSPQRHHYLFLEERVNRFQPITLAVGNGYMGIVGILGFGLLLLSSFVLEKQPLFAQTQLSKSRIFWLRQFLIFGFILATVGGGGAMFAAFISAQIRAYERISIFLSFFCILAFCIMCELYFQSLKKRKFLRFISILITIAIFALGLREQSYFRPAGTFDSMKAEFQSDAKFVKMIENTAGESALILQLPYQPFPEVPPIENMQDYSHTRGYLHSDTLRWSYGAYKGREADLYLREMTEKPTDEMLSQAKELGFSGVYVDTFGYTSEALLTLEEDLLQWPSIEEKQVSENERLWFFHLPD